MAADDPAPVTTVDESGMVAIPASLRSRLDIEPGDELRWHVAEDGSLSVELDRERYGAFDDFDPVPMGGGGSDTHDLAGHERDPTDE